MHHSALQRWLQLTLSWKLGASALNKLLTQAGSVEALCSLPHSQPAALGLSAAAWPAFLGWQQGKVDASLRQLVDSCMRWRETPGHTIIPLGSADYPPLLATCTDPPPQLFVRGNAEVLHLPQLAMVGSRKPTADGRRLAHRFAGELVQCGYQITSGLALGVDAESHRGALAESGVTIAVLGSGVDMIYPKSNSALAEQIVERGALVSEFPPDALADAWHFPERNRIISGLSHGVLVVEAAEQSGSLITARLGAEQGREVFAIPGSINNPLARGCHRLLRQGAHLVESIDDILAELPALVAWERETATPQAAAPAKHSTSTKLSAQDKELLAHIGYDPVPLDVLVVRSGKQVPTLLPHLTALELQGRVELRAQGYVLPARR